jgi:Tannase-like family of unknown function (DUF6351)
MRGKVLVGAATLAALLMIGVGSAEAATLSVRVLSNRADLISGGDALVTVKLPKSVSPASVKVTSGASDLTSDFAVRPNGSYEGLVTGLALGSNALTAEAPGATSGHITIVNHANGGPVLGGPQIEPWVCTNVGHTDAQCNAPTTYEYKYMSSITDQFEAYDPSNPPIAGVATTTTDNGATIPYIIRVETGYEDRDQYKIAVLFQPGMSWEPWTPQPQFNHKLLITGGAGCGITYEPGEAPSVINETALQKGFAVMSTALQNAGHNCNIVTEAESLMIAKEHLIEQYGTLRYTIGLGGSGGALLQHQVANAYPGIYQGLLPSASFQDAWSNAQQLVDDHLSLAYFEHPETWGKGIAWTPTQIAAVDGPPNTPILFDALFWETVGEPACGEGAGGGVAGGGGGIGGSGEGYDPETNPGGVRCGLADYMINVFGPRPASLWEGVEKKLGHGFAGLPIGNVGVQYGLQGLIAGTISPAQFVDINSKIGGVTVDLQPQSERSSANEPALKRSYLSGAVNEANNLASVPIINQVGPNVEGLHDPRRTWSMRARLERAEGHFPLNQVIWFGAQSEPESVIVMDQWLSAVEADNRKLTLAEKVAQDRPAGLHDECGGEGVEAEEVNIPGVGPVCQPTTEGNFPTPRMLAGEDITTDDQQCQLKPLERSSYSPITFTEEEWAQLQKAYPTGVCDFSKPGVSQTGAVPWQSYQSDASGTSVIYGGKGLRRAPARSGEGWTSSSFAGWLKKG